MWGVGTYGSGEGRGGGGYWCQLVWCVIQQRSNYTPVLNPTSKGMGPGLWFVTSPIFTQ